MSHKDSLSAAEAEAGSRQSNSGWTASCDTESAWDWFARRVEVTDRNPIQQITSHSFKILWVLSPENVDML